MRLEDYWGVGPKTKELLESELGTAAAIDAIESANSRALMEAGLSRGRATRILRQAQGGEGMAVLATSDTREVYKALLDLIEEYAVTRHAADRIRVLTPLMDVAAMEERLEEIRQAMETWGRLDPAERQPVLAAFEEYDSVDGGEQSAVEAAIALATADVTEGPFAPVATLDTDALADAVDALAALEGDRVADGADEELDRLRSTAREVEALQGNALDIVEEIQADTVRGTDEFREAFLDYLTTETDAPIETIRDVMPMEATDATDFVSETLRSLRTELEETAAEREATVRETFEADIKAARSDIDAAVAAVDDIAFELSLARFALEFDLTRPTFVTDRETVAVEDARNLLLEATEEDIQPITYAIGSHGLTGPTAPPSDDQVTVLTGANSGGKTTLLETLCQVALLAQMGLPVPASHAEVTPMDAIVFHRRHASFNAGVLESTLRSIVPPLAAGGRSLMLVDEFEAITEPGSAADLLHGLVKLTVDRDALGVFVTHLADDLAPLPDAARIDGIFAQGLNPDLELEVDYQPQFGTVGRSTPEFIVSRLVADATDRTERAGFETLAEAIGEEAVQRTLADAKWSS
ncbi:MAG: DNA mismatch repair protein [Halobacteriales archaeon]